MGPSNYGTIARAATINMNIISTPFPYYDVCSSIVTTCKLIHNYVKSQDYILLIFFSFDKIFTM